MTPQHLHLALHLRRDHQGTRALDKALHDGVNSDRCGKPAGCDCKPTRQLARVPRIHARLAHSSLLLRARHLLGSPSRGLHACFCLASDLVSSHLSSARVPCAPHRPVPGACMPPSSFHGPPSLSLSPSLPPSLCALTGSRRSDKVGEVARHQREGIEMGGRGPGGDAHAPEEREHTMGSVSRGERVAIVLATPS